MEEKNPSDRLFDGEADTVKEAFRCAMQQYRNVIYRIQTTDLPACPEQRDRPDLNGIADLERRIRVVETCRREYNEAFVRMEAALAARWESSADDEQQRLGEALRTKDFRTLAF